MVALPTFVIPRIIMLSPIKSGIGWFVGHLEFQDGRHNITCIHYGYIKHNTLSITMDVLQMDTHRYLNEFMHLSVSKVSQ